MWARSVDGVWNFSRWSFMPESVEAAPADDEWHRPVHNSNVLTIVLLLDDN
jgi:hypothetical protein